MKDSDVIIKKIYPLVEAALNKNSRKFIQNINLFFNSRHEQLFDIAPYDNIYFNKTDVDALWKSIGLTEEQILPLMEMVYYWDLGLRPKCATEPYIVVLMCAIRYYLKKNDTKNAEITTIYLCFNGKIYASIHSRLWKYPPRKQQTVMDFVVNNMLSDKFDLKKEGSVFGAIKKLSQTWLSTYGSTLKKNDISDDDIRQMIQQIRDRVKSFLKNIASLFYEAVQNKNYLNYEEDNLDEDNFRLTSNDFATAARITASTMNIFTSQKVNMGICNACVNESIKSLELRDIMEGIIGDNNNLPDLKKVVNVIICDFMEKNPGQRINSPKFINESIKPKPNTKSPMLIDMRNTIYSWLDENSANYRRRKSRLATANNYYKAVISYIVLTICKAAQ